MGGPERVKTKIESYSHQEFNNPYYLNSIEDKIKQNKDLFGRTNNTYNDEFQKYFFDEMKTIDLDVYTYPKKLVYLVKDKFPYLIK
jgi:hypothetical protein